MSRLGVSSVRAFSVNKLPEVVRTKANNTLETALALPVGTICNATMTKRAVDFYSFQGVKGQAVAIDCAAVGSIRGSRRCSSSPTARARISK
jgi:hypothetical protein